MDARGKILNFAYTVLSFYSYFYSPVGGIVEAQGYSTCEDYSTCSDCINNGCVWCWDGSSGSCISTCALCQPSPPLACYSSSCPECSSDSDCKDKCYSSTLYINGKCSQGNCVYDEYDCNSGAYCDEHSCGGDTYYCDGSAWVTSTTGDLDNCATCCKCEGYHWDSAVSCSPLSGDPCPTGCCFCCGDDTVERWKTGNGVCCDGSWHSGGECCSDADCPSVDKSKTSV